MKTFNVSLIDDNFDYENSDLKLNFLQKFARNANAECANENMSNFYGWSNQPKSLEWSNIVQNFKVFISTFNCMLVSRMVSAKNAYCF